MLPSPLIVHSSSASDDLFHSLAGIVVLILQWQHLLKLRVEGVYKCSLSLGIPGLLLVWMLTLTYPLIKFHFLALLYTLLAAFMSIRDSAMPLVLWTIV